MKINNILNEGRAGGPQASIRKMSAPSVSTVDTSAPWVQNKIQQARQRKRSFNELATDREKFDFLYNLKSGKTTNTIKIQGPAASSYGAPMSLNIEKYNPATGDIELVGYTHSGRSGSSTEHRFSANTDTFNFNGRQRKGVSGSGFNYYFSPGQSLKQVSQGARVKPQAPVRTAPTKPASPWDILDKKRVAENLRDPKDNPCWKGYHPVGTKEKNGRTVPNCVPTEGVAEDMAMDIAYVIYVDGKPIIRLNDKKQAIDVYTDLKKEFLNKKVEIKPAQYPKNSFSENVHNAEYSDEAGMSHTNLITIARAAKGLLDTIDQHEDLPEWVQEKIARVEGMLVSAWDYLKSQEAQGIDPRITEVYGQLAEDWQKVNKRDKTDGMSSKAVKAYRREHPGSKLQTAVTTKPSKLKAGSKAAKRRKSFCARMSGVKGPMKDEKGRPTAKAKALRRWNCE